MTYLDIINRLKELILDKKTIFNQCDYCGIMSNKLEKVKNGNMYCPECKQQNRGIK